MANNSTNKNLGGPRIVSTRLAQQPGKTVGNTYNPPADLDVSLPNFDVADKLKEISDAIIQSVDNQVEHDKTVLDLTLNAIESELYAILNDNESTKLPTEKPADNTIDNIGTDLIERLRQQAVQTTIDNAPKYKTILQCHITNLIESALTKTIKSQIEVFKQNVDVLTVDNTTLNKTLDTDDFTGNIFQRIWHDIKNQHTKRIEYIKALGKGFKQMYDNTIHLVISRKYRRDRIKKTAKAVWNETKDLWVGRWKFIFGSKTKKEKLKEKHIGRQVKQLDEKIHDVINQLRKNSTKIYKDISNFANTFYPIASGYESRQAISTSKTKQKNTDIDITGGLFMKTLAGLAGVAALATFAYGLYKLWPALQNLFALFGSSEDQQKLAAINLKLPDVPGFNKADDPPTSIANLPSLLDITDDDAKDNKLISDTKLAFDENVTETTSAVDSTLSDIDNADKNRVDALNKTIDENNVAITDEVTKATINIPKKSTTTIVKNLTDSVKKTNVDNITVSQSTNNGDDIRDTVINTLKPQTDPDSPKTSDDLKDQSEQHVKTSVEELESTTKKETLDKELNAITDELVTALDTYDEHMNISEKAVNIDNVNVHHKGSTAQQIVNKLTELNKVLVNTLPTDKIKQQFLSGDRHSPEKFKELIEKKVTKALSDVRHAQLEQRNQIERLKAAEDAFKNAAIDANSDKSDIVIVDKEKYESLTKQIDFLEDTITTPIRYIMEQPAEPALSKVNRIKEILTKPRSSTALTYGY